MVWWLVSCATVEPVPTVRTTRGDVEVRLSFQGELEAEKSVELVTPKIADRSEITFLAEHGERVETGDMVVRFETEEIEKRITELKNRRAVHLTRIESERAKLTTSTDAADRRVVHAALDAELAALRRTTSETVARVDREQGRIDQQKAGIDRMLADNNRAKVELNNSTRIRLLQLEVEDMDADIAKNEERVERATLYAPSPGLLLRGHQPWNEDLFKVGDKLWPGVSVVSIPDLSTVRVRGWAHEVDAPRVGVGQIARVVLDAVPDQPTGGEVVEIAEMAKSRGEAGVKHVEVLLDLDQTTEAMKPGMSVEVQLAVASHQDRVNMPLEAVFYDDRGAFVWVAGVTGFSKRHSRVIDRNDEVAVLEDLEVGLEVASFDPERWERGERPD